MLEVDREGSLKASGRYKGSHYGKILRGNDMDGSVVLYKW